MRLKNSLQLNISYTGITSSNSSDFKTDLERQISRQIFNDYIKDYSEDNLNDLTNTTICTSTPTHATLDNAMANLVLTPIKGLNDNHDSTSLYQSLEQTKTIVNDTDNSLYKSLDNTFNAVSKNPFEDDEECKLKEEQNKGDQQEEHDILSKIYSSTDNHTEKDECKW